MKHFILIVAVCFNFAGCTIIGLSRSSTTKTIEIDSLTKEQEILKSGTEIEIILLDNKCIEGTYEGLRDSSLYITTNERVAETASSSSFRETTLKRKRTIQISDIKQIQMPGTWWPLGIGLITDAVLIYLVSESGIKISPM